MIVMKKRILILYAKTGGGHRSLALALSEVLQSNPDVDVSLFDPFPQGVEKSYEVFGSSLRFLWGLIWHLTDSHLLSFIAALPSKIFLYPKLVKKFREIKPDVVITNHPLLCSGLRRVLHKAQCYKTKIVVHVADPFTLHAVWFSSPDSDMFLLPTEQTKKLAISYGVPPASCEVVGWLLRSQFLSGSKRVTYQAELPYVFIGSGGQGGGNTFELMKEIIDHPSFLQKYACVVSTGSNTVLAQAIKAYVALKNVHHILILPATDDIDEYMRGACFVVGKLGPNFLFESLALEKSVVATSYIPGQEDGNVAFVREKNIGWVELDTHNAFTRIYQVLEEQSWMKLLPQVQHEKSVYILSAQEEIGNLLKKLMNDTSS